MPMLTSASKVTVGRPPSTVFPYLIEPPRQALWSDAPMKQLTEGPMTAGSRMEVSFGMGPMKATVGLEIKALEPDQRIAFRSFSGPIRWDGEYRLRTGDSSTTELSQEGRLVLTGLWRLVEPLAGAEIKRGEIKELERLKAVVEAREPA
jgi:hypothetical protein